MKYTSKITTRVPRPRSKRLREQGLGSPSANSTVVMSGGVGGNIPSGDGHSHPNKPSLDAITTDNQGYQYITRIIEKTDPATGETTVEQLTEKVKAGYADIAGDLSKDSPARKEFISRLHDDVAKGNITFEQAIDVVGQAILRSGAQFGSSFVSGLTGCGGRIDGNGNGELRGLRVWNWLEVQELRYNQTKVFVGVDWQVPGAGIIESATPDKDTSGNDLLTGTAKLKLEDGQYGAIAVDDIVMGIFHMTDNTKNATVDSDDSKGNFTFAGFATIYFRITSVSGKDNGTFTYSLRSGYSVHPQPQMNFACYGNFTNVDRQTSTYRTRTYTRRLWRQNTWEISVQNIAAQEGDLSNLNVHGLQMSGYSAYYNNIYFTGKIQQTKPDGTPLQQVNECGKWKAGKYGYYDRVSHNGSFWLCVNEKGTTAEPSKTSPDWLFEAGADGAQGAVVYRLVPTTTVIKVDGNGHYSQRTVQCMVVKHEGESATELTSLPAGYSMTVKYDGQVPQSYVYNDYADAGMATNSIKFTLINNGSACDAITIPIMRDGTSGTSTATYKLQPSHSSVQLTPDGDNNPQAIGCGVLKTVGVKVTRLTALEDGMDIKISRDDEQFWSCELNGSFWCMGAWKRFRWQLLYNNVVIDEVTVPFISAQQEIKPTPTTEHCFVESSSTVVKIQAGGWSDSIPHGSAKLWMSKRKFSQDPLIQEASWSYPQEMKNNYSRWYLYSSDNNPLIADIDETNYDFPGQDATNKVDESNLTWKSQPSVSTKYIAVKEYKNGIWGEWERILIKGEKEEYNDFVSYVFLRSNSAPARPSGGIYLSPVPNNHLTQQTVSLSSWCESGQTKVKKAAVWRCYWSDDNEIWELYYSEDKEKTDIRVPLSPQHMYYRFEVKPYGITDERYSEARLQLIMDDSYKLQGVEQCVTRKTMWETGVEYHNDTDLIAAQRYNDIVFINAPQMATGLRGFKCKITHLSSSINSPLIDKQTWEELAQNVVSIMAELIIARNASIDFMQGNELLIKNEAGDVVGGFTGGKGKQSGSTAVRLWIGSALPDNAPFRVLHDGTTYATKMRISGDSVFDGYLKAKMLYLTENTNLHLDNSVVNGVYVNAGLGRLPRLKPGEVSVLYYMTPVITRVIAKVRFEGEDSSVQISLNGDYLHHISKGYEFNGAPPMLLLGIGEDLGSSERTVWSLLPIGEHGNTSLKDGAIKYTPTYDNVIKPERPTI